MFQPERQKLSPADNGNDFGPNWVMKCRVHHGMMAFRKMALINAFTMFTVGVCGVSGAGKIKWQIVMFD